MNGTTELRRDIESARATLREYDKSPTADITLLEEIATYMPTLLDLAELLAAMLDEEEAEAEAAERKEKADAEPDTAEMLIQKGVAMMHRGVALQKAEAEIVFLHGINGDFTYTKHALRQLYESNDIAPNAVISNYIKYNKS